MHRISQIVSDGKNTAATVVEGDGNVDIAGEIVTAVDSSHPGSSSTAATLAQASSGATVNIAGGVTTQAGGNSGRAVASFCASGPGSAIRIGGSVLTGNGIFAGGARPAQPAAPVLPGTVRPALPVAPRPPMLPRGSRS